MVPERELKCSTCACWVRIEYPTGELDEEVQKDVEETKGDNPEGIGECHARCPAHLGGGAFGFPVVGGHEFCVHDWSAREEAEEAQPSEAKGHPFDFIKGKDGGEGGAS